MPSKKQNTLDTVFPRYGDTGIHSTSVSSRLAEAYPNSPIHSRKGTRISSFTHDGIKSFYFNEVLSGEFDPDSDFFESDYDYSAVPQKIPQEPEKEASPGSQGSTIVSSGKGPNVATISIENLSSVPMVEVKKSSVPPFNEEPHQDSPKSSTEKISGQSIVSGLEMGRSSK